MIREEIIKKHDEEKLSFAEIGKQLNLSRQRIHQIYHCQPKLKINCLSCDKKITAKSILGLCAICRRKYRRHTDENYRKKHNKHRMNYYFKKNK